MRKPISVAVVIAAVLMTGCQESSDTALARVNAVQQTLDSVRSKYEKQRDVTAGQIGAAVGLLEAIDRTIEINNVLIAMPTLSDEERKKHTESNAKEKIGREELIEDIEKRKAEWKEIEEGHFYDIGIAESRLEDAKQRLAEAESR